MPTTDRGTDGEQRPRVDHAEIVASAPSGAELPAPVNASVAFAGRSNVGKSSLLNTLLSRKSLARTSRTPGCTRTINLFRAKLEGGAVVDLVDLPGYGFAARSHAERKQWGRTIESMLRSRTGMRAVVVLVDVRRGVEPDDADLIALVSDMGLEPILVVTKTDKLPFARRGPALRAIGNDAGRKAIGFSAENGEGRSALWRALLRAMNIELMKGV